MPFKPSVKPCRTIGEIQYCQGVDDCGYSCTGTLIGPATVLTAGHCLYELGTPGVQGLEGGTVGAILVRTARLERSTCQDVCAGP